jgi:hypothetical protein
MKHNNILPGKELAVTTSDGAPLILVLTAPASKELTTYKTSSQEK